MYKNIIISILLFILSLSLYSQDLGINYNSTGSGRNITANYTQNISHNALTVGIGFNINSIKQPDDQSNIYYKRLYATASAQHLNFNLSYQHDIFYNLKNIKPFVFYDFQIKYSTTRSSMYLAYAYDTTYLNTSHPEDGILYKKHIAYFGPYTWIENSIGLGFRVNITDRFYMQQRSGVGLYFVCGYGSGKDIALKAKTEWEFMVLLNIGIVYRLQKKSS